MEEMLQLLESIKTILEQIVAITQNQTTVLLSKEHTEEGLALIEEMSAFKEELTTQMEQTEASFQALYDLNKKEITSNDEVKIFQEKVSGILTLKDYIIAAEQNNVLLLQDTLRRYIERVELPRNAKQVVKAYAKQKSKETLV